MHIIIKIRGAYAPLLFAFLKKIWYIYYVIEILGDNYD
jgi:hypothetical protein